MFIYFYYREITWSENPRNVFLWMMVSQCSFTVKNSLFFWHSRKDVKKVGSTPPNSSIASFSGVRKKTIVHYERKSPTISQRCAFKSNIYSFASNGFSFWLFLLLACTAGSRVTDTRPNLQSRIQISLSLVLLSHNDIPYY